MGFRHTNSNSLKETLILSEQENNQLRENYNKIKIELNEKKEKEIKIIKILYQLYKTKGINIEELIENESNEMSRSILQESFISTNSVQSV